MAKPETYDLTGNIIAFEEGEENKRYNVFHRTWWRWQHTGTGQRVRIPGAGKRTYIARGVSWVLARQIAKEYNDTHDPGRLSRKAEIEED